MRLFFTLEQVLIMDLRVCPLYMQTDGITDAEGPRRGIENWPNTAFCQENVEEREARQM